MCQLPIAAFVAHSRSSRRQLFPTARGQSHQTRCRERLRVDIVSKIRPERHRRHNSRSTYSRSASSSIVGALTRPRMGDVGGTGSSARVDRHAAPAGHLEDPRAWLVESDYLFDKEKAQRNSSGIRCLSVATVLYIVCLIVLGGSCLGCWPGRGPQVSVLKYVLHCAALRKTTWKLYSNHRPAFPPDTFPRSAAKPPPIMSRGREDICTTVEAYGRVLHPNPFSVDRPSKSRL